MSLGVYVHRNVVAREYLADPSSVGFSDAGPPLSGLAANCTSRQHNYHEVTPMKNFFVKLWKDEEGAELVEWVVIVGLIAVAAIATYAMLETRISAMMNTVISNIEAKI